MPAASVTPIARPFTAICPSLSISTNIPLLSSGFLACCVSGGLIFNSDLSISGAIKIMITSSTRKTSVRGVTLISLNSPTLAPMDMLYSLALSCLASVACCLATTTADKTQEEKLEQEEVVVETLHYVRVGVVEDNREDSNNQPITRSDQRFGDTEHHGRRAATAGAQLV